jgi:hypothetical protein
MDKGMGMIIRGKAVIRITSSGNAGLSFLNADANVAVVQLTGNKSFECLVQCFLRDLVEDVLHAQLAVLSNSISENCQTCPTTRSFSSL